MSAFPFGDEDPFEDIELSAEAHAAIRSDADPRKAFQQTATRLSNGAYRVPLQRSTIARLMQFALAGESLSDAVIRLIATKRHPLQ